MTKMIEDQRKKALEEILKNCQGDNHSFRTINSFGEGMGSYVTKWCRKCGCVRMFNCDAMVSSQTPEVFDLVTPAS